MYRCEGCKVVQLKKTPMVIRVGETRPQHYTNVVFDRELWKDKTIESDGTEIVSELRLCSACAGVELIQEEYKLQTAPTLSETPAAVFKKSFAAHLVEKMVERAKEIKKTGDSADRDFMAYATLLAPYQARGGGL